MLEIKTKPHLVVIFNQTIEANLVHEFYKAGIPILSFDRNLSNTFKTAYKTFGNFNFVERNIKLTFFFFILLTTEKIPFRQKKNFENRLFKQPCIYQEKGNLGITTKKPRFSLFKNRIRDK